MSFRIEYTEPAYPRDAEWRGWWVMDGDNLVNERPFSTEADAETALNIGHHVCLKAGGRLRENYSPDEYEMCFPNVLESVAEGGYYPAGRFNDVLAIAEALFMSEYLPKLLKEEA
jgi:hypothetical protein